MLVKFKSSTAGELVMFAETARQTVAILRKDALARGVITAEELPVSISFLSQAIQAAGSSAPTAASHPDAHDPSLPIGLAQRLVPFLEFLQRTQRKNGYVMWEAPADFGAQGAGES